MSTKLTKLTLSKETCCCDISEFYRNVAAAMGINDFEYVMFDCKKICVSKPVQDTIFAYYEEKYHCAPVDIGMTWADFGPKATLDDPGYVAEVDEGFIVAAFPPEDMEWS